MIFDVKKVDPNVWLGHQGETALHIAARNGYVDFVKFLLEAGAHVNQKGNIKNTHVHEIFGCLVNSREAKKIL